MIDHTGRLLNAQSVGAERLIAVGRAVAACFALVALSVDPSEPAHLAGTVALYALGAVAAALWTLRVQRVSTTVAVGAHAIDLLAVSFLHFATTAVGGPFFACLLLPLFAAALRWRAYGVFCTAAVAALAFAGGSVISWAVGYDGGLALHDFSVRLGSLVAVSVLLMALVTHEDRLRRNIAALAGWPDLLPVGDGLPVRQALEHAARVLDVPRLLLMWRGDDDIDFRAAVCMNGVVNLTAVRAGQLTVRGTVSVGDAGVIFSDPVAEATTVVEPPTPAIGTGSSTPIPAAVRDLLGPGTILGLVLPGAGFEGRLFAAGRAGLSTDDVVLGEAVAWQLATMIDASYLADRVRESAPLRDRVRLAHDLHDGIIQSLAALGIGLETLKSTAAPASTMRRQIARLQSIVAREQEELRALIRDLRAPSTVSGVVELPVMLRDVAERMQREWHLRVEIEVPPITVPRTLGRDVCLMVREALVNAGKHGGGSRVLVGVRQCGQELHVTVGDDGRGFPFVGHYEDEAPAADTFAPWSLRERLVSLGGHLAIDSRRTGARVEMTVPLAGAAGEH